MGIIWTTYSNQRFDGKFESKVEITFTKLCFNQINRLIRHCKLSSLTIGFDSVQPSPVFVPISFAQTLYEKKLGTLTKWRSYRPLIPYWSASLAAVLFGCTSIHDTHSKIHRNTTALRHHSHILEGLHSVRLSSESTSQRL